MIGICGRALEFQAAVQLLCAATTWTLHVTPPALRHRPKTARRWTMTAAVVRLTPCIEPDSECALSYLWLNPLRRMCSGAAMLLQSQTMGCCEQTVSGQSGLSPKLRLALVWCCHSPPLLRITLLYVYIYVQATLVLHSIETPVGIPNLLDSRCEHFLTPASAGVGRLKSTF